MKNMSRISACLVLGVLLAACGQVKLGSAPTATLSSEVAAVHTDSVATVHAKFTKDAINITMTEVVITTPAPSVTQTTTVETTPTQPIFPLPNQIPTIEPTKIPGLLKAAFSFETLDSFNGHGLQRFTGWSYGFDGFQWMDTNHLLLYPIVGWRTRAQKPKTDALVSWATTGIRSDAETYPVIINLDSKNIWMPQLSGAEWRDSFGSYSPHWSAQLESLIVSEKYDGEDAVAIRSLDGELIKIHSGKLLGVSPSGTKILLDGDTWLDLVTGKIVDFAWDQKYIDVYTSHPWWSTDETRLFICCHLYGNAKTAESYSFSPYDFTIDGEKTKGEGISDYMNFSYGAWVLGDTYFIPYCCTAYDSLGLGFIPLFDPSANTFRNVNILAGIPIKDKNGAQNLCNSSSTAPNREYIWMNCFDGSHLVDLSTFESKAYPNFSISDIEWSADSEFAWIDNIDDSYVQILSTSDKELKPSLANSNAVWHPIDRNLAYLSKKGEVLSLLDARTMTVEETTLPIVFREIIWSPKGENIALLAEDNSLWQIDYPTLENLEQLTPAMPGSFRVRPGGTVSRVRSVAWSADGTSLAFIGDMDIYIVDTRRKPAE